jgi:hypothetical protein
MSAEPTSFSPTPAQMSDAELIAACRDNDRYKVPTVLSRAQYSEAVDRLERYGVIFGHIRRLLEQRNG